MDKLKSFGSKMNFSSTPGGKLSKAFRLDKEHNVLKRSNDPFMDGPTLEDVSHMHVLCTRSIADLVSPLTHLPILLSPDDVSPRLVR